MIYILKEEQMISTLDSQFLIDWEVESPMPELYQMEKRKFIKFRSLILLAWIVGCPICLSSRNTSMITNLAHLMCNTATTKNQHLDFQFKHSETLIQYVLIHKKIYLK